MFKDDPTELYLSHQIIFGSGVENSLRKLQIKRDFSPIVVTAEILSVNYKGIGFNKANLYLFNEEIENNILVDF